MDSRPFDDYRGLNTQQSVRKYLKLVARYNDLIRNEEFDSNDRTALEEKIQKARDNVHEQHRYSSDLERRLYWLGPVSTEELEEMLRRYRLYIEELPPNFIDPPFVQHREAYYVCEKEATFFEPAKGRTDYRLVEPSEPPLVTQKNFLEKTIREMEAVLAKRGVAASPVDIVASQIQQRIQIEARLAHQCETDVKKYPSQEVTIRRSYRKAIDALREEQ